MAYRIEKGEAADEAVHRIACEQIDAAIASVDRPQMNCHETLYEIRKRCKTFRGLLRLVRPALEDTFRVENAWYGDTAKSLSSIRDERASIQTLEEMCDSRSSTLNAEHLLSLRQLLAPSAEIDGNDKSSKQRERIEYATQRLRQGRERVADWQLGQERDVFERGLLETYARARRAMKRAQRRRTPESLHSWRKHVKYHSQHLRLLREFLAHSTSKRRRRTQLLSKLLGEIQDLAVLHDLIELRATADNIDSVLRQIDQRRSHLQLVGR